ASLLLILLTKSLMTCLAASGGTFDCPGSGRDEMSGGFGPFGGGTSMSPPPPPPVPMLTPCQHQPSSFLSLVQVAVIVVPRAVMETRALAWLSIGWTSPASLAESTCGTMLIALVTVGSAVAHLSALRPSAFLLFSSATILSANACGLDFG